MRSGAGSKKENPRFRQSFNALNLITRSGVELLCAAFAIQFEPPKSLVKAPKRQPVLPEAPKPTPKQRPMVLDVPGSYECTRLVNEAKRYAVTVQTMLDRYIMYRSAEDLKGYRESLELITSDLCSKVYDLRQVKIKEIESPAF